MLIDTSKHRALFSGIIAAGTQGHSFFPARERTAHGIGCMADRNRSSQKVPGPHRAVWHQRPAAPSPPGGQGTGSRQPMRHCHAATTNPADACRRSQGHSSGAPYGDADEGTRKELCISASSQRERRNHCLPVSLLHCFIVSLFHCFTVSCGLRTTNRRRVLTELARWPAPKRPGTHQPGCSIAGRQAVAVRLRLGNAATIAAAQRAAPLDSSGARASSVEGTKRFPGHSALHNPDWLCPQVTVAP